MVFSSLALKLSLFSLAFIFALVSIFGTPHKIKQGLGQSGVYNQVVESAVRSASEENKNGSDSLSLARPEIQAAAKTAITPVMIRGWAEGFIDGFYGWLEGKTAQPEFRIDLTDAKQNFIQQVADQAESRLKSLPACSVKQTIEMRGQNLDPFTIPCRPPVDIAAEKQRVVADLEKGDGFLKDPVITAEDLSANNKQSFNDSALPENFQRLKSLPTALIFFSLLLIVAVVFLAPNKRVGFKKVFIIFLGTGVFLLLSTLIFAYLFNSAANPTDMLSKLVNIKDSSLQTAVLKIIDTLFQAFNRSLILVAAIYTALGGIGLLTLNFTKPKAGNKHQHTDSSPPADDYEAETKKPDQSDPNTPTYKQPLEARLLTNCPG